MLLAALVRAAFGQDQEPIAPHHRTVELNVGESADVDLVDKSKATIKLIGVEEVRDSVRQALREARVTVEINGDIATIVSANYRLPQTVGGVQVDCTATNGLNQNSSAAESWGLEKAARLRLWPAGSRWMPAGQFVYPAKQRWFASATQMGNEPSHVDGGDAPVQRSIYYHNGLDIGGAEGMVEVVAATDGVVVSAGLEKLPDVTKPPVAERYDVVYIRDARNWYYRYSHLKTIDVKLGAAVKKGERIGLLGKEGASGGWSHLHFEIQSMQPSGKWGTEEGYAFLWEAYQQQYKPAIIAVARPHHLIWAGESVTLDGSRSWSAGGKIDRYEWTCTDGTTASGARLERKYDKPGEYSEVLKIVDAAGNIAYDFAVVLVIDPNTKGENSPTIHACYSPTTKIRPGDPVTFKVRSFFTVPAGETWDFGDGTPPVKVRSDANENRHDPNGYAVVEHRFAKPGDYIATARHPGRDGHAITSRVHVHVAEAQPFGAGPPEVVSLWPAVPPDDPGRIGDEYVRMSPSLPREQVEVTDSTRMVTNVSKPIITVYRPDPRIDSGTSVLICPGGGYWNLYWELEGEDVAKWLVSRGITGIVLKYRVPRRPEEDKTLPARRPLQDAQRAVSLVRANAAKWNLHPDRIGMIGFSAGGHLVIATATEFDKRTYPPVDAIDEISCRPDFGIAAYSGYLKPKDKFELSPFLRVPEKTPPIFLVHGSDDVISSPENSVVMYVALRQAKIPAELHIYASTSHDFGIRTDDRPYGSWTKACEHWLVDQKVWQSKVGSPR
jgi:acetyl esterase/lipase/murein DD-endopeptidase MepM/ murein hydrolase activator NlpD